VTTTLYRPPDVDEAYHEWSASCGPCALAAMLGRPLADVRSLFPGIEQRNFCNPSHVEAALNAAQVRWRKNSKAVALPVRGLAFLQVTGPWDGPGVPVAAAYRKTHWISTNLVGDGTDSGESDDWVYDCNAAQEDGTRGDWWPRQWWERDVMVAIVAAHNRATGWRVRVAYEVRLP
jgi:hypothetical protein